MLVHRLLGLLLAIPPLLHFSSLGIFSDAKLSVDRVKECMDSILDGKNYRRKVADPMFVLHFGDAAAETFNVLSPHEMKSVEALAKCTQEEDSSLFDRYPHTYFTGSNVTFISGLFQSLLPGIHEKVLQAVALGLDDAEWLLPAAVAADAATITPTKSTSFPTNTAADAGADRTYNKFISSDNNGGGSIKRARAKRKKTRAEDVHAAFGIRTVQYLSFQKEGLAKYKTAIQEARNIQRPALIIYPNEEEAEEANRDEVVGFHFQKTGKRDRGSGGSDLYADIFDPNADDAIADFLHYYGPLRCGDAGEDEGKRETEKGEGGENDDESSKGAAAAAAAGGEGSVSRKGTVYAVFIVLSDREEFLHGELLVHKDAHYSSESSGDMPGSSAAGASASSSSGSAYNEDPYDDEGLEELSLLAEKKRLKDADRKTQVQHQDREGTHASDEGKLSSMSATGDGEGEKFQRFHALHSRVSRFTPERGSVVLIDAAHKLGMQQVMFGSFRALFLELWSYDDAPVGVRKVSAREAQPLTLSESRSRSAAGKNSVKSDL